MCRQLFTRGRKQPKGSRHSPNERACYDRDKISVRRITGSWRGFDRCPCPYVFLIRWNLFKTGTSRTSVIFTELKKMYSVYSVSRNGQVRNNSYSINRGYPLPQSLSDVETNLFLFSKSKKIFDKNTYFETHALQLIFVFGVPFARIIANEYRSRIVRTY